MTPNQLLCAKCKISLAEVNGLTDRATAKRPDRAPLSLMSYSDMIVDHRALPALPKLRDGGGPVTGGGLTSFSGGFLPMKTSQ